MSGGGPIRIPSTMMPPPALDDCIATPPALISHDDSDAVGTLLRLERRAERPRTPASYTRADEPGNKPSRRRPARPCISATEHRRRGAISKGDSCCQFRGPESSAHIVLFRFQMPGGRTPQCTEARHMPQNFPARYMVCAGISPHQKQGEKAQIFPALTLQIMCKLKGPYHQQIYPPRGSALVLRSEAPNHAASAAPDQPRTRYYDQGQSQDEPGLHNVAPATPARPCQDSTTP